MDCELKILRSSLIDYISYIILQGLQPSVDKQLSDICFLMQNILLAISPVLSRAGELLNEFSK